MTSGRIFPRSVSACAAALAASLVLSGCISETLTIPPVEPRKVDLPGTAPALNPSASMTREHRKLVSSFGGEYRAPKVQAQLDAIAERLRLVSDRPNERYAVTILNSPAINAFALPNGNLYLTRGLLALANDQAEIASVMAHEIAHVLARHAMERAEFESQAVLVSRVLTEVLENPGASQIMRDQSRVALASFSRQQEIDADEIGVRMLARAGFEAQGALRLLASLDRSSRRNLANTPDGEKSRSIDILATHPATPERLAKATLVARQFGAPGVGETSRAQWLQALSGLTFGEDPSKGLIDRTRFVHPRLRFAFQAPDGFVLENTPQAVLGVTGGAREALRLDSSREEAGRALTELLAASPIEGKPIGEISATEIAGLPAATGLARSDGWTFRVVLVRTDGMVHRMIFAAQGYSAASDARFLEAARSFRRIDESEARAIRAQRIGIQVARATDRPEDLAARMQHIPQALEMFYLLNGLSPEDGLEPGQPYKIIE